MLRMGIVVLRVAQEKKTDGKHQTSVNKFEYKFFACLMLNDCVCVCV